MPQIKKSNKGILFPPLVGYSFNALLKVFRTSRISPKYYYRVLAIVVINLINLPFRVYERIFINPRFENKKLEIAPIFIIGHWRSGTTHLHNLLSHDKQMGYVSTYQSVFPDTLFNKLGRFLFRNFMGYLIPKKREGDNVTLGPELPQEEEFTLGHRTPLSHYLFWFFPKKNDVFFKKCIKMETVDSEVLQLWKEEMHLMVHKALKNTNGKVYLSKNPPNTARIPLLLEMFPNAKFIHIHRNPIEVYLSTQNFFKKMMPYLQLEIITQEEINEIIINNYKNLMGDYFENKKLILPENLFELSFEQLEKEPLELLKSIYKRLSISGYSDSEQVFKTYIDAMRNYKKNSLSIRERELQMVLKEWHFAMEEFNYEVPNQLKIVGNV